MPRDEPATSARYLPGYGASRVLIDGALRNGFGEALPLLIALAWVAVLADAAITFSTELRDLRRTDPPPGSQIVGLDDPAAHCVQPTGRGYKMS
jgi:hypothetical protein